MHLALLTRQSRNNHIQTGIQTEVLRSTGSRTDSPSMRSVHRRCIEAPRHILVFASVLNRHKPATRINVIDGESTARSSSWTFHASLAFSISYHEDCLPVRSTLSSAGPATVHAFHRPRLDTAIRIRRTPTVGNTSIRRQNSIMVRRSSSRWCCSQPTRICRDRPRQVR